MTCQFDAKRTARRRRPWRDCVSKGPSGRPLLGRAASGCNLICVRYSGGMTQDQDIPNNIRRTVEKVLRDRLGPAGFSGADIRGDRDVDGDPILLIDVNYNFVDRPISSKSPTDFRRKSASL